MLMINGQHFIGLSGMQYLAHVEGSSKPTDIGGGDVRLALMHGWMQPPEPPPYIPPSFEDTNVVHPEPWNGFMIADREEQRP